MEQVGTDDDDLLGAWRRGQADRLDLYKAVRAPVLQTARQGIGFITSSKPDPHDVADVVHNAFLELERQDPASVVSLVGLARKIAYRRGQDAGRRIIREREQMRSMMVDLAVTADPQFHADDVRATAEREVLVERGVVCLEGLTTEQRDIVQRRSWDARVCRIGRCGRARPIRWPAGNGPGRLRRCAGASSPRHRPTSEGGDRERR